MDEYGIDNIYEDNEFAQSDFVDIFEAETDSTEEIGFLSPGIEVDSIDELSQTPTLIAEFADIAESIEYDSFLNEFILLNVDDT